MKIISDLINRLKAKLEGFGLGRNKKVLLLVLLLAGGGSTSVLVIRKAAAPKAPKAGRHGAGDFSATFKRAEAPSDDDSAMPADLASRSGFKRGGEAEWRSGGAMGGEGGEAGSSLDYIGGNSGIEALGFSAAGQTAAGQPGTAGQSATAGGGAFSSSLPPSGGGQSSRQSRAQDTGQGGGGESRSKFGPGQSQSEAPQDEFIEEESVEDDLGGQAGSGTKAGPGAPSSSLSPGGRGQGEGVNFQTKARSRTVTSRGKSARSARRSGRGRAAIGSGEKKWESKLEDLRQRTSVAYGSGDDAESAAGGQDTVYWGGRASQESTPGGGGSDAAVNLSRDASLGPSLGGMGFSESPILGSDESGSPAFGGWTFDWEPKIYPAGPSGRYCANKYAARDHIVAEWRRFMSSDNPGAGGRGILGSYFKDVETMTRELSMDASLASEASMLNKIFNFFGLDLDACINPLYIKQSFYSDITLKLYHPQYAPYPAGIEIRQCSHKLHTPPPYGLMYEQTTDETFDPIYGLETNIPTWEGFPTGDDDAALMAKDAHFVKQIQISDRTTSPDENAWRVPGRLPDRLTLPGLNFPSSQHYYSATPAHDPHEPPKKITEYVGYGVFRLTYGFCVRCTGTNRPSMWPSVYFSLLRNLDGSVQAEDNLRDPNSYKRCIPANSPLAQPMFTCNAVASCVFKKRCNLQEIKKLLETEGFRNHLTNKQAEEPGITLENVCDDYCQIQRKVGNCITGNGLEWDGRTLGEEMINCGAGFEPAACTGGP
ncbi:MAG: hypothetical protein HY747_11945 [Elusimicrobia bacterium]|nr:hypothetical protein [Elusimicrobiota bacterium]